MAPDPFPSQRGIPSFWRTQPSSLDKHRSTPDLPTDCEYLVIGAGYSGATFAKHLLDDPICDANSIVMIEARELCSGATGRNGGHLKPDYYFSTAENARNYGFAAAAEVAEFERANLEAISRYVIDNKVDCDLVVTRSIDVQLGADVGRKAREGYDLVKANGIGPCKEVFAIPEPFAEKVSGVRGALNAFSFTAGHLWPYKLISHMIAEATKRGMNLQTQTTVFSISDKHDADGYWTVETSRGSIRARKVVVTTNAYTASVLPEYEDKIIPYRSVCCRIACAGGQSPLLNSTYALRFSDWDFDYLIPRPDGSIIVGGARSVYLARPAEWYKNTNDGELIGQASSYFDGYMQRNFHGWENSDASVTDIWSGIMGYSADRLPRIGHVPNRPGVYVMGGFSGHGMPQVFLASAGLAGMVRDGVSYEESGLPRLFRESPERLQSKTNQVSELWKKARGCPKL